MTNPNQEISSRDVERIHARDDLDVSTSSHHHTVGTGPTNASPGNHNHLGKNSELLEDYLRVRGANFIPPAVAGSTGGNVALQMLLAVLHDRGIITNNTTA